MNCLGFKKKDVNLEFTKLREEIEKCNCIKYAAYRTAAKLRVVQKGIGFDGVRLSTINGVLECHRILLMNSNITVSKEEIEHVLHDIFYVTVSNNRRESIDLDLTVELNVRLMKEIFGFESEEHLSVLNFKVFLISLCSSPLQSKYQYWFHQLADHNIRLTRSRLKNLLLSLLSITKFLHESNTFSKSLIQATLDSCFTQSNESFGINESEFICWTLKEPQILVWLSTLYRMRCSEDVVHRIRCAVCGMNPVKGLRYSCLSCLRYDLCQNCFFTGRTTKRHKVNHKIREYCSKTSCCEMTIAYVKCLIDRLCGHTPKLQYLPARSQTDSDNLVDTLLHEASCYESLKDKNSSTTTFEEIKKPQVRLQDMITQIESETERLTKAVDRLSPSDIRTHTDFLRDHLDRLKTLKKEILQEDQGCFMSTPLNSKLPTDFEMSSIVDKSIFPSPSGFSTWVRNNSSPHQTTYTQQLQNDLDVVMKKLNCLLESNFTDDVTEETVFN